MSTDISIRRAAGEDIPFILATERGLGFERLVGRAEEAQHRADMEAPGIVYLIGGRNGRSEGFAILRGLDDPFGNLYLKRIAVREPGTGFGQAFLRALLAWAYGHPHVHRFYLDVFPHNDRARHVYRRVGLREDGLLREAYVTAEGVRHTLVLMSILRPEWELAARARGELPA